MGSKALLHALETTACLPHWGACRRQGSAVTLPDLGIHQVREEARGSPCSTPKSPSPLSAPRAGASPSIHLPLLWGPPGLFSAVSWHPRYIHVVCVHTHIGHSKAANRRSCFLFVSLFLRTPRAQLALVIIAKLQKRVTFITLVFQSPPT